MNSSETRATRKQLEKEFGRSLATGLLRDLEQAEQRAEAAERRAIEAEGALAKAGEHCRNWIGDERCGKPAEFIVWGKLFDPDALGPRCYDCAASQIGHNPLRLNDNISYAVYRLPAPVEGEGQEQGLRIFKDFTAEEIYEALSEAIWEHERSPATSIWFSFWDRLNEGVNVPSMPVLHSTTKDPEEGDDG